MIIYIEYVSCFAKVCSVDCYKGKVRRDEVRRWGSRYCDADLIAFAMLALPCDVV